MPLSREIASEIPWEEIEKWMKEKWGDDHWSKGVLVTYKDDEFTWVEAKRSSE